MRQIDDYRTSNASRDRLHYDQMNRLPSVREEYTVNRQYRSKSTPAAGTQRGYYNDSPVSHLTQESTIGPPALQRLNPTSTVNQNPYHHHHHHHQANNYYDADVVLPSPIHREKLNRWYQKRFPVLSRSHTDDSETVGRTVSGTLTNTMSYGETIMSDEGGSTVMSGDDNSLLRAPLSKDGEVMRTKQSVAVFSIILTSAQLLILMLQLTLCGVATLDVNPMVGPFPDAFSEWGGKNAYLMLKDKQWWRMLSPALLHVGLLHLLVNAFCQLGAVALFEREWGSFRWILIYLVSAAGCSAFSNYFDPDTIAVESSGALMGLFAAKLAQVMNLTFFEVTKDFDDYVQLDQLSSVLCGLTMVSVLSSFTYIDWSGHMGGLLCGFLSGVVLLSGPIRSCCTRFFWVLIGLAGLGCSIGCIMFFFVTEGNPDEDLADTCDYFRNLYPEGYECGCL